MREERGIRRRLGQIYYDIHHFECGPDCLSTRAAEDSHG